MDDKPHSKHHRGSNGSDKGKKSKRSKRKSKKSLQYGSSLGDQVNTDGPDHDSLCYAAFNNDSITKVSTSVSACSGFTDDVKKCLGVSEADKGKISPLWLMDSDIKENFLKMADQASDFDISVWNSIKFTLSQKSFKSLSAKYKSQSSGRVYQFDSSKQVEESLRWEYMMDDVSEEQERLHVYKINRRKRFLAERHAKGLELLSSINKTEVSSHSVSTNFLDLDDESLMSQLIIDPLGFKGADDSRDIILNCS